MVTNNIDGAGIVATKVAAEKPKQVKVAVKPPVAAADKASSPKAVKDEVNISSATSIVHDYEVNSENEVVVTVTDKQTETEIRQIPSKESQAARQAFRQVVAKLFDKTV